MPRKTAEALKPKEMTQDELEAEHLKRIQTIERSSPSRKGRIKGAQEPPPGDTASGEVIDIVAQAIEVNTEALEWHYGERDNAATADGWARILVAAIRYGIPYDDYAGEGFHIQDDDSLGDAPLCQSCAEEEE